MDPTGRNLKDQDDQKWSAPKFRLIHKYCWGPLQNPPHLSLKQLFHWQTMYMYTYTYCIYLYVYKFGVYNLQKNSFKVHKDTMLWHHTFTGYLKQMWISPNCQHLRNPTIRTQEATLLAEAGCRPPGRLRGVEVTISMTPLEMERWQLDGFSLQNQNICFDSNFKIVLALKQADKCTGIYFSPASQGARSMRPVHAQWDLSRSFGIAESRWVCLNAQIMV